METNKDNKTIDGIKPQTEQINSQEQTVPVSIELPVEQNQDVSINSNGDIAAQSDVIEVEPLKQPEETSESQKTQDESSQSDEIKASKNPEEKLPLPDDDPGIVPSIQPALIQQPVAPETEVVKLRERNKHLKIWLVVLVLFLVAVTSALVVYFAQQEKAKSDLKAQQEQNAALQQELNEQQQTATQQTIDELNKQVEAEQTKNTELQATIDELEKDIISYQEAVKKLLTTCGTTCSTVDVPDEDVPTDSNTTN